MALVESLEKQGNFLFKYRGQFPVVLFLLAIPFIYFTDYQKANEQLYLIIACICIAIGFMVRFYTIGTTPKGTSGRNTKNQVAEELNFTGIYSVVRHPLYLGNYLIWLGIACIVCNLLFLLVFSLLFWIYYERIMYAEERFLEKKFGQPFLDWSNRTPAFFPSVRSFIPSSISFSAKSVLRREYAGVLATVLGVGFFEFLKNYFNQEALFSNLFLWILGATVVLTLLLRTLKHHTKILSEENRS